MNTRKLIAAMVAPLALAGAGLGFATTQANADTPAQTNEDYYSVELTGDIEVSELSEEGGHQIVQVPAKVCVEQDNPSSENGWSRISLDPWQLPIEGNDGKPIKAWEGLESEPQPGDFPMEGSYKVGECAEGLIPFRLNADDTTDGNKVVWDSGLGQTKEFTFEYN